MTTKDPAFEMTAANLRYGPGVTREAGMDLQELGSQRRRCLTSNFVLDEVLTLLGRRVSYDFAAARAATIWGSAALTILRPDEQDELAAIELFSKFADQGVSFTDCISFALMRRHRVRRAFTFDRHFEAAGFQTWPA